MSDNVTVQMIHGVSLLYHTRKNYTAIFYEELNVLKYWLHVFCD